MQKTFLVVGGGTAGWVTATLLKSIYPDAELTLIENTDIGTIGVGESTTPAILDFLEISKIDIVDFIKKTDSTIKVGINFENWLEKDSSYLHTFDVIREESLKDSYHGVDYLGHFKNNDHPYRKLVLANLVPLTPEGRLVGTHSLHIDATKMVDYLKDFMKDKVSVINDLVTGVSKTEISSSVLLDSGNKITADVIFDCSGFKRVVHEGTIWKSLKNLLPVDRAIPCPVEWDNPMNTTHASALSSGWVWQVPLKTRLGTGYVYSSEYAKDPEEEFINFIKKKYNKSIEPSRVIKFESGYVKNPWNERVVCIGLSSGFLEPLESTSIHMIIHQVLAFTQLYDGSASKKIIALYNNYMCDMFEDTAAFIKLHYMAEPYNNDFWKYMNNSPANKRLEGLLDIWKKHLPIPDHIGQNKNTTIGYRIFALSAWLQVLAGMKKIDERSLDRFIAFNNIHHYTKNLDNLITQKQFLENLNL